jgi:hypothetical protein
MRRLLIVAGVLTTLGGQLFAQNNSWKPLGGWQLIERLDDVQIVKVLRASDLMPAIFPPKPTWQPDAGDFFPASDELLYYRWATQGQYYAYDSEGKIVLDDVQIEPYLRSPAGRVASASVVWRLWSTFRARVVTRFRASGQVRITNSRPTQASLPP